MIRQQWWQKEDTENGISGSRVEGDDYGDWCSIVISGEEDEYESFDSDCHSGRDGVTGSESHKQQPNDRGSEDGRNHPVSLINSEGEEL